jgi:hypothetical protein
MGRESAGAWSTGLLLSKEDTMSRLSISVGIGALALLLGAPALVCAQDEPKEEPKAEPRQEEVKPPKQDEPKAAPKDQPKATKDDSKPPKESKAEKQEEAQQGNAQGSHPAGSSGHIPDKEFKSHFGRSHTVVINQPVIVEGQPRFQYSGYWFVISQPWPVGWAYSDQCYIDYVDGEYVLFDLLHPGVSIVLLVVM